MVDYKMQLLGFCLLVYIGIFHVKYKRLQTYGNQLFSKIIIVSIIYIIFDMITVYLVKRTAVVPPMLNRICHQIFIGSLDIFLYLIATYIMYIVGVYQNQTKLQKVIHIAPISIALLLVLFGPLYYYVDEEVAYSYGPAAITCYVTVAYYLCRSIYYAIRRWEQTETKKREVIFPALFLVAIIAILQGLFPNILMSGFGVVVIVFCIFLSLENPSDYIEKKSGVFNREGFLLVLKDLCDQKEYYSVITVYITNMNEIRTECGLDSEYSMLQQAHEVMYRKYRQGLYLTFDGCISIIVRREKELNQVMKDIQAYLDQGLLIHENLIHPSYEIHTIVSSEYEEEKEVYSAIVDRANKISYTQVYRDILTGLKNRNAYEKDIQALLHMKDVLQGLWYIIIDLNNLKSVNDTYGHIEGDYLLRDCAKLLLNYADKNHRIYRIGGDEICMIIINQTDNHVEELVSKLERDRLIKNKTRNIPISFALGYSAYRPNLDVDFSEVIVRADKMMYHTKNVMKHTSSI